MAKIVKQKFTNAKGERKIYSYLIPVSKILIEASKINPDKEISIKIENGKLVISN